MKFNAILVIVGTLFTALAAELTPLNVNKDSIKGQYIIKLKGNTRTTLNAHVESVKELFKDRASGSNEISHVYESLGNSYAAKFSDEVLKKVLSNPDVEYVEADSIVKAIASQSNAPWGLARISQRAKLADSGPYTYNYNNDGAGVTVYVVDTGILTTHTEFEGRAVHGKSFPSGVNTDDNGHGTHCAGTIGSKTYGVSKKVSLVGVKVLDKDGSGTLSNVVAGINYAAGDKRGTKGNVISMSLGGGKTQSLNDAADAAYKKGLVVVVAAGNDNKDACNYSPASTPSAITVGAMDVKDARASFSNYGKCVDVFAPGVAVLSTWKDGKTNTISGTSMACPHVAGLAAYYLSNESLTPAEVATKIVSTATKNAVTNPGTGSPNLLAYNSFA